VISPSDFTSTFVSFGSVFASAMVSSVEAT
jgi:hypothetical protein